jgi:hypothetical protein
VRRCIGRFGGSEAESERSANKKAKSQYRTYMGMFKPISTRLARHEDQQSPYDRNITGAFPEDDNLFIFPGIAYADAGRTSALVTEWSENCGHLDNLSS